MASSTSSTRSAAHDAAWGAAAAGRLFAAPLPEVVGHLGALLGELLPLSGPPVVGVLTGDCSRAPLKVAGPADVTARITSTELAALSERVTAGEPWVGTASVAGRSQRVLVIAAAPSGAAGSLFAIPLGLTDADLAITPEQTAVAEALCGIAALAWTDHAVRSEPASAAASLAVKAERGRVVAELGDAHDAALSAVLAALRARDAPDQAARVAATDLATAALIELRERGDRDRDLTEERAGEAFDRLCEQLAPIARYAAAQVELVGPAPMATDAVGGTGSPQALTTGAVPAGIVADELRFLPADIAHAARATTRGIALVLLEQEGVSRLRIAWQVGARDLLMTARDDGPGTLAPQAFDVHRIQERLAVLGGAVSVEAVAGWGTAVSASLPLSPPLPVDDSPLAVLNAREREVLAELARGSRNAQIADALTITTHTVKFHVANILRKLGVSSRGEAAALAHAHPVD